MEEALKEYGLERIRVGDVITGKVISVSDKEVTVNIGYRSDGIVNVSELPNESTSEYKPDDEIQVMVVKTDDGEGNVVLSVSRAYYAVVWDEFSELMESQDTFTVKVKEAVKGGLVAKYKGARVFIPASLVSINFVSDLTEYIGKDLEVKMADLDLEKKKAVASRKSIEKAENDILKKEAFATLKPGIIKSGKVARIEPYGAFIDLGGYDGLMHVSQMSWRRISHPTEVMKIGDIVDAEIISVNPENEKISLKLANAPANPWNSVEERYVVGGIYDGKIERIQPFGFFISLEEGIEGLCHISEISKERIKQPSDFASEGDTVKVKILSLDKGKRKIALSIKKTDEDSEENKIEESVKDVEQYIEEVKPTTFADLFGDKLNKFKK